MSVGVGVGLIFLAREGLSLASLKTMEEQQAADGDGARRRGGGRRVEHATPRHVSRAAALKRTETRSATTARQSHAPGRGPSRPRGRRHARARRARRRSPRSRWRSAARREGARSLRTTRRGRSVRPERSRPRRSRSRRSGRPRSPSRDHRRSRPGLARATADVARNSSTGSGRTAEQRTPRREPRCGGADVVAVDRSQAARRRAASRPGGGARRRAASARGAEHRDAERREQPAEPDRAEQDAFEHTEHAAEHVIGDDALEQRQSGDVGDRVADPDDGEREQCHRDS